MVELSASGTFRGNFSCRWRGPSCSILSPILNLRLEVLT